MSIVHDHEFETEESGWQEAAVGPDDLDSSFEDHIEARANFADPDEIDDSDDPDDHGDHDDEAEMRMIQELGLDHDLPDSVSLDLDAIMGSADDESIDDDLAA